MKNHVQNKSHKHSPKASNVDFDDYANQYRAQLASQNNILSGDRSGIYATRINLLAKHLNQPVDILDFGCGIGMNFPFLSEKFPNAKLSGSDISQGSMKIAAKENRSVKFIADDKIPNGTYDLILVSGVIHHVPPDEREAVFKRLRDMLKPQGNLAIFEHNPFNPVTRHMVHTCEFDEGVIMLTQRELLQRTRETARLTVQAHGYYLFFPTSLKPLTKLEPLLKWLPLGGQHFVIAQKL